MQTRTQWGARPPKSNPGGFSQKLGFQLHHFASPRALADHNGCDDQLRSVQNYHMDNNGWSDIAYNFLFCNHGETYEGRGWDRQNGATGNATANDTRLALCWMGHSDKDVFDIKAANAIKALEREGNARGWPSKVDGHREFSSTSCPGNVLMWWMDQQNWQDDTPPPLPVPPPAGVSLKVLNTPTTTIGQMQRWGEKNQGTRRFLELAIYAWTAATASGVDPALVYAIMGHETAFGRFGGVLTPDFHNWGGIKTAQGGSNDDPHAHQRFNADTDGVRAVAQHAGLYGGAYYPAESIVDPRHFEPLRGVAPGLPSAGWGWAGSTHDENLVAKVIAMRAS